MNIYLTGFTGCGKSAAGVALAKILSRDFIDCDTEVVRLLGESIADFIKRRGETEFRHKERAALISLSFKDNAVIAAGGGTLLTEGSAEIAKANGGVIVFIDTPFEICYGRICSDPARPLVFGKPAAEVRALFDKRYNAYQKIADYTVNAAASADATAAAISKLLLKDR